eukprot:Gb_24973 [translate_table: standard]
MEKTKASMDPCERARQWLLSLQMPHNPTPNCLDRSNISNIHESFVLRGLRIQQIHHGRVFCIFKVPRRLTDKSGAWHLGALTSLVDNVGAAAIMSCDLPIKVSVDWNISYISAAKVDDEIEIDAQVLGHRGGLSTVVVELRNKATGELVAQSRQWMHNYAAPNKISLSKI